MQPVRRQLLPQLPRRLPPRQGTASRPPISPSCPAGHRQKELVVATYEGAEAERDQKVLGCGGLGRKGEKGPDDTGNGGWLREARRRVDFPALRNLHHVHMRGVPA